jgi:aspartyl-tRNA(Asn)/glutamyl-tRNA(Gln) amidotransferase subunit B
MGIDPKYARILHQDKFIIDILTTAKDKPNIDLNKLANLIANKKIRVEDDVWIQYQEYTRERQSDPETLNNLIDQTINENAGAVADYRSGKTNVLGFLVGQVMKLSKGQSDPQTVSRLLLEKLERGQ